MCFLSQGYGTIDHLLDLFLCRCIWGKIAINCRRTNRIRGDVVQTFQSQEVDPFQCVILNHMWKLIPGFLVQIVWKERNKHIFKRESNGEVDIWNRFKINLLETLLMQPWTNQDLPVIQVEVVIFNGCELGLMESLLIPNPTRISLSIPDSWRQPLPDLFKLNFDGASKGNPRSVGFGGVIRDQEGNVIH